MGGIAWGVVFLLASVAWLRWIIPFERWAVARSPYRGRAPQIEQRWYRYAHVYGGALFLGLSGAAMIISEVLT